MLVQKAYKLRLYPTRAQEQKLREFGSTCRWLWNQLLYVNQEQYRQTGRFMFCAEMSKWLPWFKSEYEWVRGTPACSLQRVVRHLDQALRNRFSGSKGFPRFKSKHLNDRFYVTNQKFRFTPTHIRVPNLSAIRFRAGRLPDGKVLRATIRQDGDQWHCSVLCEVELPEQIKRADTVGIDLGLKDLATCRDGTTLENPKWLRRSERKLKRLQRRLSKSKKGSSNRKKRQLALKRAHRKIRNQRQDHLHKFTTAIAKQFGVICLEDLNIRGMLKNHCLAKAISDTNWGELLRQLRYKSQWYEGQLVQIDRFAASSKTCRSCGNVQDMPLRVRTYDCPNCDLRIDRDLNAAINIREWGLAKIGQELPESGSFVLT